MPRQFMGDIREPYLLLPEVGLIKHRYISMTSFQTLHLVYIIVAYKSCHDFLTTAVGFMQVRSCKIIWKRTMIF